MNKKSFSWYNFIINTKLNTDTTKIHFKCFNFSTKLRLLRERKKKLILITGQTIKIVVLLIFWWKETLFFIHNEKQKLLYWTLFWSFVIYLFVEIQTTSEKVCPRLSQFSFNEKWEHMTLLVKVYKGRDRNCF